MLSEFGKQCFIHFQTDITTNKLQLQPLLAFGMIWTGPWLSCTTPLNSDSLVLCVTRRPSIACGSRTSPGHLYSCRIITPPPSLIIIMFGFTIDIMRRLSHPPLYLPFCFTPGSHILYMHVIIYTPSDLVSAPRPRTPARSFPYPFWSFIIHPLTFFSTELRTQRIRSEVLLAWSNDPESICWC